MTPDPHDPVISVMLAVSDASEAARWYGNTSLVRLDTVL
jgi:hypothetical protein